MTTDLANLDSGPTRCGAWGTHATVDPLVAHVLSLETQPPRGDVDAACSSLSFTM